MRLTRVVAPILLILPMFLALGACAPPAIRAVATFTPLGDRTVGGSATFTERGGTTVVRVEAHHIAPGRHGVHVHAVGDCSAADGSSAGPHFNPGGGTHGHGGHHDQHQQPGHNGDLGNLEATAEGSGVLVIETETLTVTDGPLSVVGRAIVIHAREDDQRTSPGGAAGARIGCGVITRSVPPSTRQAPVGTAL